MLLIPLNLLNMIFALLFPKVALTKELVYFIEVIFNFVQTLAADITIMMHDDAPITLRKRQKKTRNNVSKCNEFG